MVETWYFRIFPKIPVKFLGRILNGPKHKKLFISAPEQARAFLSVFLDSTFLTCVLWFSKHKKSFISAPERARAFLSVFLDSTFLTCVIYRLG